MNLNADNSSREDNNKPSVILTVDFEDWKAALLRQSPSEMHGEHTVDTEFLRRACGKILATLDNADARATFFIVGSVLRETPSILEDICKKGHEIAYHSPFHVPLSKIPKNRLEDLIKEDSKIVENTIGRKPIGFRAPYFSVTKDDGWLIHILTRTGFKYDSSVVPSWTPLYGIPSAPRTIYRPDVRNLATHNPQGPIVEVPVSTWPSTNLIPSIPLGGLFIRLFPEKFLLLAIRRILATGLRPVLYLHPGDLDVAKANLKIARIDKLIQYTGLRRGVGNLGSILRSFKTESIESFLSRKLTSEKVGLRHS